MKDLNELNKELRDFEIQLLDDEIKHNILNKEFETDMALEVIALGETYLETKDSIISSIFKREKKVEQLPKFIKMQNLILVQDKAIRIKKIELKYLSRSFNLAIEHVNNSACISYKE